MKLNRIKWHTLLCSTEIPYPKGIVVHRVGEGEKRFRIVDVGVNCGLPVHKRWVRDGGGSGHGRLGGLFLLLLNQTMKFEDGEASGTTTGFEPWAYSGEELGFNRCHFGVCSFWMWAWLWDEMKGDFKYLRVVNFEAWQREKVEEEEERDYLSENSTWIENAKLIPLFFTWPRQISGIVVRYCGSWTWYCWYSLWTAGALILTFNWCLGNEIKLLAKNAHDSCNFEIEFAFLRAYFWKRTRTAFVKIID